MTSVSDALENMSIDKWLAELHMECYKKNFEKFNTIRVSKRLDVPIRPLLKGCLLKNLRVKRL